MKRPIINVDLDGVVYDFVGQFASFYEAETGVGVPRPTTWDFWNEWDMDQETWQEWFRQAVESGMWSFTRGLISGAKEALDHLSDLEYHIRILTTRLVHSKGYDEAAMDTVEWLQNMEIPYRSLAIVGPGDSKSNYEAHALIDDHGGNIEEFVRIPGRLGVIFSQPWNTQVEETTKIARAHDWYSAAEIIKECIRV